MPTLQTDILPKMKGKKNDRKRAWFGVSDDSAQPALLLKMNIPFPSLFKVLFFFFFFIRNSFPGWRTAQSAQSHIHQD